MGALILEHDWSDSSLGPVATWPLSLQTILGVVLRSPIPMVLLWGEDGVMLYNDAYSVFAGSRHPEILGSKVLEGWPEVAAFNENVMKVGLSGGTLHYRDQELTLHRRGRPEQVWMNLDYSPVLDESGEPAGVLGVVAEITERVAAEQRREAAEAALRAERDRSQGVLDNMDEAFVLLDREFRIVDMNAEAMRLEERPKEAILGKTHWEAHPDAAPELGEFYRQAMREQRAVALEHRYVWPDGRDTWIDMRAFPVGEGLAVFYRDVTDRKLTEVALTSRERELQILTDALPVLVAYVDADRRYRFVNKVYETWFPRRREDIIGKPVREVVGEAAYAKVAHHMDAALRGERVMFSQLMPYANAPERHIEVEYIPRKTWDGRVEGFYTLVQDVTARKSAEEALRAGEERFRAIVETATDYAIFTTDPDGRIETWPAGAATVFGWTAEQAVGQLVDMTYTPEDRAQGVPEKERQEAREKGQAPNVRWHLRQDGSRVFIEGAARPLDGKGGAPSGFVKVGQDVTERRQAEVRREALVQLAARLRDLDDPREIAFAASEILGRTLDVSRVGYATIDDETETLHVEQNWTAPGIETLAGTLRFRDYGSFIDSLKQGDVIAISDVRLDRRTVGAAEALEARSARSFMNVPVMERGRLVAMFFVNEAEARDWSAEDRALIQEVAGWTRTAVERVRSAAALRDLNETLEQRVAERTAERDRLWKLSEDMLARADYQGMMSAVSPAWTRVLGWSETELLSRPYSTFMHPEDTEVTLAALMRMGETGQPTRFENRIATSDGGWKSIEWTVAPEPDAPNFIAVGRDLSEAKVQEEELRQAQEALRQSQKMEAMGSLTGGVAHDFNNLLTPIIGSLDRLLTRGVGSERERRLMDGALQSAERAKTLVQRLLAFAKRQPLQPGPVDVGRLVGGMAELIASTSGPRIDLRVELAPDLPPALADANQLEMALLNLAVNARDAMPDSGVLTISAARESVRGPHPAKLRHGHYLRLSVKDTGTGMDEATLARAVEPFFSTKGIGKGTGLGLSMVHGLASQLGGGLTITSRPSQGTTVDLWLPISAVAAEEERGVPRVAASSQERGTALLVDDEDLVRLSTADMLADLGYEVVEASSGEEALRLLSEGLRLDLVVTDHLMPGLSGGDLARDLRSREPDLPVLIVSGYAEVEGIAPGFPRLTKPFRAAELAASLAALTSDGERLGTGRRGRSS